MSLQSHLSFLNIFEETHKELVSLNSAFNQLLITYKLQENLKIDNDNEKNEQLNSIESIKQQLDSQEEEAYLHRLFTNKYYTNDCLTKVNYDNGLIKYKQIQNYTKAELNIFLLAMTKALIRAPEQT
ncbi:19577_t:CDS:2, partial [Dentiscutata erythropus]